MCSMAFCKYLYSVEVLELWKNSTYTVARCLSKPKMQLGQNAPI